MRKTKRKNKSLFAIALTAIATSFFVSSAQTELATDDDAVPQAVQWLKKLNTALSTLNFDASFVLNRQFKTDPYRWRHAVVEGVELEQLSLLNGSGYETVRRGNQVSYFEPSNAPYTIISDNISGPVPDIFYQDSRQLSQSYELIMLGRERIAGRLAQQIKIQPKTKDRYSYTLSLDADTGMLLKMLASKPNSLQVEDLQVTSLVIKDKPDQQLLNLVDADLPSPSNIDPQQRAFNWQVSWLPSGFKKFSANMHRLAIYRQLVEHQIFSDGMVNISVYMAHNGTEKSQPQNFQRGATSIVRVPYGNYDLTVIGKIPMVTASKIAQSVEMIEQ